MSIVYVGCAGSSEVHVLALDDEGRLTPRSVAPLPGVTEHGTSMPMALSPDRRFLYAGLRSEPYRVVTFRIGSDGGLEPLGEAPLADTMAYIATDRTGRTLFSASYHGGRIAVNGIGPDGCVGPVAQVLPTQPKAHAIQPDATNTTVLATSLGGDLLLRYRFFPGTGTLAEIEPAARTAAGAGPRHFAFHPNGRFLFLLNELDATVDAFEIAAGDAPFRHLQNVSALPDGFSGKPWAADIHVTPDGGLLYASERTSSRLFGYRIDQDKGTLTPCGSWPTETQPRAFAIDDAGILVAAGEMSNAVSSYRIDLATGALAPLSRLEVGSLPNWVEILPDDDWKFV